MDQAEGHARHVAEPRRGVDRQLDRDLGATPVVKPGQRIGEGLDLGRAPRFLEPQVRAGEFGEHRPVRLMQEQHLHGEFRAREILIGQAEARDRLRKPDPEAQVDHDAPARHPHCVAAQRHGRAFAQAQEQTAFVGQAGRRAAIARGAQRLERGGEAARVPDQLADRPTRIRDPPVGVQVNRHWQQRPGRRKGAARRHRRVDRQPRDRGPLGPGKTRAATSPARPDPPATSAKLRPLVNRRSGTSTTMRCPGPVVISASAP